MKLGILATTVVLGVVLLMLAIDKMADYPSSYQSARVYENHRPLRYVIPVGKSECAPEAWDGRRCVMDYSIRGNR